ncbi:TonB-dependent receptor [Pseudoduganella armeniaca]|uniref:TonB-dependent receptor n=2 Tax=Pseudoduganella armeniaca TaxID=2072590 RepID=A0A2R4CI07_9BURK|nr:TonB-dependent receptor [Pseudoduganella armeniaca]
MERKPLSAAVALAMLAFAGAARAQLAAEAEPMQKVEVTGIRASLARSLNVKRNATANVEVVTAEDVGKMPDKNLADSLQRLPGVAVRTDYDEAEKVSMRGTNPDMSLIIFNGHAVSTADWYIVDQNSSSRSTSLSLVPSSVLNQAIVYKTAQANIVDGGLAGTINVTTRKPLAQKERLSGVVSAGVSYADLPGKSAPDANASVNWKNDAGTLGLIVQGFAEKRHIRRDSVSRLAYGASSGWDVINTGTMQGITDASLAGTGLTAADLNGVRMPGSMSAEFVEGVRDRKGGMFSLQYKPNDRLDVTTTGFYSKMKANNYGRLTSGAMYSMLLGKADPLGGLATNTSVNGRQVFASIRNPVIVDQTTLYGHPLRVLQSAEIVYPDSTPPQYIGNSEAFYRDGATAESAFLDLDASWRASDDLRLKLLASTTRGVGKTARDQGTTWARYGTGVAYRLGDVDDAPFVQYFGAGENRPGLNPDGSGYTMVARTASSTRTVDRESSLQLDAEYRLGWRMLTTFETGLRYADHRRRNNRTAPAFRAPALGTAPAGYVSYPSDFGKDLDGKFDNTGFYFTPQALKDYINASIRATTPEFERRVVNEIDMRERQSAFYVMQNFDSGAWSGNVGLRFVRTRVNADIVAPLPAGACLKTEPGQPAVPCPAYPGAITTAGDGSTYYEGVPFDPKAGVVYLKTPSDRSFDNFLPSLNLRYEPRPDMVARFGASRTIGRQNYNVLGSGYGTPGCNASGCTVTGPNPGLKPLTSDNVDLSWSWYFAPRSVLTLDLFHSSIDGYVKTGTVTQGETVQLVDPRDNTVKTFFVNTSSQQGARIKGIEVAFERPLWGSFGITSNVSRAKTKVDDGRPMVGASEWAGNLGGYFENERLSARLVWNYRGKYVSSTTAPAPTANSQGQSVINGVAMPTAPTIAKGVATLAASVNYTIRPGLVVAVDATNLTNTKRAQYRYSEAEQQKLDVSGRQVYVNVKYRF